MLRSERPRSAAATGPAREEADEEEEEEEADEGGTKYEVAVREREGRQSMGWCTTKGGGGKDVEQVEMGAHGIGGAMKSVAASSGGGGDMAKGVGRVKDEDRWYSERRRDGA